MYNSNQSGNSRGGGDPGPLPQRWLDCPRKAFSVIDNTFLAFKTPLSKKFDDKVPMKNRFTPKMLFDSLKSSKVCVGFSLASY